MAVKSSVQNDKKMNGNQSLFQFIRVGMLRRRYENVPLVWLQMQK